MFGRRCFVHQVTAVVMTVVMAGCRPGAEPTAGSSVPGPLVGAPVRVVVTTPLLAEIVKRVGLGGVELDVLVPTGESPTGLQRTGPVESRLVASELAVVLGLGQEEVLAPSLARAVDAGVVVCELGPILPSAQLLEVPGEPGRIDPHVWLDPALWLLAIAPIEEALCRLRPEWAGEFRKQAHAGRFELDEMARVLRRRAQTMLPPDPKPVRSSRPGLRYLARAAGVELVLDPSAVGASTERPELAALALDVLRPTGTKVVANAMEYDLGTVDGLRGYALDLMLEWQN